MRKLYGPTSWRRVLALVLVFVMMFSVMGTSGYSVFAEENLPEANEEVFEAPQEAEVEDITDTVLGESPGEEDVSAPAEEADETEALSEVEPEEALEEEAADPTEEEMEEEAIEAEEESAEEIAEEEAEPAEEAEEPAEEAGNSIVEEALQIVEAEPAEECEPVFPPVMFRDVIGGISVSVDAPEGAFPEGTEMKLAEVEIESIIDAVADAVEGSIAKIKAVDITFFYKGEEIQPQVPISVKMNASGMTADSERQVLHIDDAGEATVIEDADTSKKTVSFEADSFSVYVVVAFGEDARVKVRFVKGSEEIASMYVKKGDNMEQVIYDPAIGELPEGVIFKGWIAKENYTGNETALTIEGVRNAFGDSYDWSSVIDADEENGTVVTYHAMLIKQYTVTYVGVSGESLGQGFVNYRADATGDALKQTYEVNMSYTPEDDTHNFDGWIVIEGKDNIEGYDPTANEVIDDSGETPVTVVLGTIYQNEDEIVISGDITLSVNAPEGHWLVFKENGKGGTYNAPKFILKNDVTERPRPDEEMLRYGYKFEGWYYFDKNATIPAADAHGMVDLTDATEFTFGEKLTDRVTLYAKWSKKEQSIYTVLLWTQNLDRTGYELAGSYVGTGSVDELIPFTIEDNGAEDFVTGVGENNGHYTGFGLNHGDAGLLKTTGYDEDGNPVTEAVEIPAVTPEGDAVLNLYYDRITYNFKFYLYRESGNGNAPYTYANMSGGGSTLNDLVTWHNASSNHPSLNGTYEEYKPGTEQHTFGTTTYTYHYFTMKAFYGQDISSIWPTYDKIDGADNREPVSYVMMVGTKLKPEPTDSGSGTVKGIVSVMNENILGATNDPDGNYVIVRFPSGTVYNWRYHIWFEAAAGQDLTDLNTRSYNGKTYYEDTVLIVRSSNTQVTSQNEPKYTGFDFKEKLGQNWNNSNYWTSGNNPTLYHLNYIYDREKYEISYFDGNYVDGDNNKIQNRATHLLDTSDPIGQGALIPQAAQNYVPALPESEEGFVFEGWYSDEACTKPYEWGTMVIGGIEVYAKWRQIQYRVFLHPEVPASDKTLYWGSDTQAMNFRISYGGTVSVPSGTRTGWTLVGWYTDKACTKPFNASAFILNETTVKDDYDKAVDFTDDMDKWGNGATYNKDVNRFWITHKLDLYAKWRADIEGAQGINVNYSLADTSYDPAITGTGTAADSNQYVDNATATAVPAVDAPEGYQFAYWVMQKYDKDAGDFADIAGSKIYAGSEYTVLLENAKQEILQSHEEDAFEEDAEGNLVLYDADPGDGGTYVKTDDGEHYKKYIGKKTVIDKANYEIQLRAHYIPEEEATMTFIPWYYNDGTKAFHTDTLEGTTLKLNINQAVEIQPVPAADKVPTRAGYAFLGWAKVDMGDTSEEAAAFENTEANLIQADLTPFVYYNKDDGLFYQEAAFTNKAKYVAADEETPYQAIFAVWAEDEVTINYAVASDSTGKGNVTRASETIGALSGTAAGSTAVVSEDYADTYEFAYWTCDEGTEPISEEATFAPEKENGAYVSHTYYAHFEEKPVMVTVTVYHYLKGTDIEVADEVTASVEDGSEYTAEAAADATYEGKALTADSYDPQQTITVTVDCKTIIVYYVFETPLQISAATASKTYNGTPLNGGYTITGALNEDDEALIEEALGDAPSITHVDESCSYLTEEDQAAITGIPAYYKVSYKSGTLTIKPAAVTITVADDSKHINQPDPEFADATMSGDYIGEELEDLGLGVFRTNLGVEDPGYYKGVLTVDYTEEGLNEEYTDYTFTIKNGNFEIIGDRHLKLEKKATSTTPEGGYKLGDTVTYEITVTNDGEVTIENFYVVDDLTGGRWPVVSLAPEASATFTTEYKVTEADILAGKVVNEATVEPPTTPDTPPEIPEVPPVKEEVPTEEPDPSLAIEKVTVSEPENGKTYEVGEKIYYTVKVTNDGNLTISDIVVTDELTGDKWTIESLAPGESSDTFGTKGYTVTLRDAIAAKITNTAEATGIDPAENEVTAEASVTDNVTPAGKTISVAFYTNYPDGVTLTDEYTDPEIVLVPYEAPSFEEKFGSSKIPEGWLFIGWEVHKQNKEAAPVDAASADGTSSRGVAFTSSSATAPEDADYIFYAQWEKDPSYHPGGGGRPPQPDPNPDPHPDEPDPEIDDDPTPLAPIDEEPDEDIEEPDTPYAGWEEEPDDEIDEEPTPLSPYTGDDRHTAAWGFVSLLSLAGIAVLGRKREEEAE